MLCGRVLVLCSRRLVSSRGPGGRVRLVGCQAAAASSGEQGRRWAVGVSPPSPADGRPSPTVRARPPSLPPSLSPSSDPRHPQRGGSSRPSRHCTPGQCLDPRPAVTTTPSPGCRPAPPACPTRPRRGPGPCTLTAVANPETKGSGGGPWDPWGLAGSPAEESQVPPAARSRALVVLGSTSHPSPAC